ncbi:MAG: archease [Bdellovibrionia bacterium]
MGYQYLDHITWADTAFEARNKTLEGLFQDAAQATLSVMLQEPERLQALETRLIDLTQDNSDPDKAIGELLHEFLEKLLFHKDADQLLLRVDKLQVEKKSPSQWHLRAHLVGERIDPEKQELLTDVKAVTQHQFEVKQLVTNGVSEWMATVVLDV